MSNVHPFPTLKTTRPASEAHNFEQPTAIVYGIAFRLDGRNWLIPLDTDELPACISERLVDLDVPHASSTRALDITAHTPESLTLPLWDRDERALPSVALTAWDDCNFMITFAPW